MYLALTLCSLLLCLVIIVLKDRVTVFRGRSEDLAAVQSAHSSPTPRIGGIAIFGSLSLGMLMTKLGLGAPYLEVLAATSLLFAVGLLEDLGFSISAGRRLMAAAVSSLIVIYSLGIWMPRADVPGLDLVIDHWIVGVPVTVLITAGIANGFNLIDGVNGLAGLTALAASVALSLIGAEAGYETMTFLSLMMASCVLGFLIVNYPFGLIFLGDAGAYTIGFVLSWFCISTLIHAPEASPWALLLTVYWPVFDMLVAIARRAKRRRAAMHPDRLHMHQVVMRALEMCLIGRGRRKLSNPLSTIILFPFVAAPPAVGVALWNNSQGAFLAVAAFTFVNLALYRMAEPTVRRFRRPSGLRNF